MVKNSNGSDVRSGFHSNLEQSSIGCTLLMRNNKIDEEGAVDESVRATKRSGERGRRARCTE